MSRAGLKSPPDGIERVELKVTLGGSQVDAGLRKFDLDPDGADAERRRIFFCERVNADSDPVVLPLLARGIIIRIRQITDGPDDSTLKLRGPEGSVDPKLWQQRTGSSGDDARIEGDWAADRRLVSASLTSTIEGGRIDKVIAERPHEVRRLLSSAQEALAADLRLGLGGLELLEPIQAWKWTGTGSLGPEVVAELWELNDGLRFLELSRRVSVAANPVDAKHRFEDSVRNRNLTIDAKHDTKTSSVLERLVRAASRRQSNGPSGH